jgi:hypothetical protein
VGKDVTIGQTDGSGYTLLAASKKGKGYTLWLTPQKTFLIELLREEVMPPIANFYVAWGRYCDLTGDDTTPEEMMGKIPGGKAIMAAHSKEIGGKKALANIKVILDPKVSKVRVPKALSITVVNVGPKHAVAATVEGNQNEYRKLFDSKKDAIAYQIKLKQMAESNPDYVISMLGHELKMHNPLLGLDEWET